MLDLELEIDPASSYIHGPSRLKIPETLYEKGKLVGWQWQEVVTTTFLKGIPLYDPFTSAKGYYFDTEEWDKIVAFITNECFYPEAENTGLPFIPEQWQSRIYANLFCWKEEGTNYRRFRECFIYVPRKNGKLLDLNCPIPTVSGWRTMGTLRDTDVLFDKDGNQCGISYLHQPVQNPKSFDVKFSNGETVKACADHQWYIHSRLQHPKHNSKGSPTLNSIGNDLYEGVWTTQELFDRGVDSGCGKSFCVPMHNGIICETAKLPIDPYLLGYWLGDGASASGSITIGDQDIDQCEIVFSHKHIPRNYLRSSISQRLSLLQGLMDSYGTISKRGTDISFINKDEKLIDNVAELLASLGLKYSKRTIHKSCQTGVVGTYFQLQFMAFKDTHPVFRLQRKLDRQKLTASTGRSRNCHIVSITPCKSEPMRCITVDSPSGTYLFGNTMLPTHNTTAFGAVLSLIMFFIDSEKRAQNFCCAADIEQASLNFRHCQYIIETNPRLLSRLRDKKVFRSTRSFEHTDGSVFKVLSSIADTKHGLSPNFVYVDEVHAHANSDLIDVMVTGTGARRQPLIVYTTTADFDRPSVCNNLYEKAKAIATDKQWEPTFLPVIYEAQLSDDFRSEQVWRKANPNFGVSITEDYFQRLVRNAENNPNELNRFLRLHLNVRTKTETAWIPQHIWANGNADPETPLLSIVAIRKWIEEHSLWHNIALSDKWHSSASLDVYIGRFQLYWSWYIKQIEFLKDEECYAGYDNATVKDIAALNLWFPRYGIMLHWGWVPAQSIYQRSMEQNLPYNIWWEAGLINSTSPQETVDENLILSAMIGEKGNKQKGIFTHFRGLREVCFDRWGAHHIFTSLKQYGLPARAYPQSFAGMNEPCRRMEALSLDHQLFHGGHPVLDWMIGNVVIVQSRDGQVRPDRSKSINKIDGIVAGLMAIGSYLYPEVETISEIRGLK